MKFPIRLKRGRQLSMPEVAERLASVQTRQVENNPLWFTKYEEYCGTKGIEATRASPGYVKLYQTIRELFFTILDPSRPLEGMAKRMAETHQRIGVRFSWFLTACQSIEDEMIRLGLDRTFIARMRTFIALVAERYEQIFEGARAEALNNAERLSHLLREVMGVANTVSQSAHELSEGQRELSKRVECDAASVEEVSAALEEVGSSFRIMTQNAQDTLQIAHEMAQAVNSLQAIMTHMVDLMNRITSQAHRTKNILNTITEVAFQTNILSLNASVEAARLGSLGSGFSVIAKEIRKLSDKVSAEAHSIGEWINTLIEDTQKSQDTALRAAADLDKLSNSSDHVSARMEDTNSAILDTETGFSQVREAIASIDDGLQKTAAMVEEISAAADTLLMQAQHLMNIGGKDTITSRQEEPVQLSFQKPEQPIKSISSNKPSSGGDWETF